MSQLIDFPPRVVTLAEAFQQPAPTAAPTEQQAQFAPLWPAWHPEASGDAHYRRVVTLAALLDMTRGLDLPPVSTWDLAYERPGIGEPSIRGQIAVFGGDQQRREAVAAWVKAVNGHAHVEVWEDGRTRIAAQCRIDGVLIEVWTLLNKREIRTDVPAVSAVAPIELVLGDDTQED